ncbi:MAG TPA: hypothetical protein VMC07_00445 [Candidatus Omnitrophota bacterium]|nr:hypothetical protein [Candidatus Omnitrophota bacterium]
MAKKRETKHHSGGHKEENLGAGSSRREGSERMLIENFVSLQDVMTNLSEKLNNLANQMSKLLELFEQSAKTFMEKDMKIGGGADKDLISKLDRLLEQNKIIAQGITLLHEEHAAMPGNMGMQPPEMPFTQNMPNQDVNRYQRSISSSRQDAKIQPGTGQ